jgi:hypothetical protein
MGYPAGILRDWGCRQSVVSAVALSDLNNTVSFSFEHLNIQIINTPLKAI